MDQSTHFDQYRRRKACNRGGQHRIQVVAPEGVHEMKDFCLAAPSQKMFTETRPGRERVRVGLGVANERGTAMVEMAVMLPLLLLLLTGILAFGVALNNYLVLTNAVGVGAQYLAISRGQTTDPCATTVAAVQNAAPNLTTVSLVYSFSINGTAYSGTTCTAAVNNMVQGQPAMVKVTYPCTLSIAGTSYGCLLQAQTTEIIQ